tara:strand:- start:239 stop:496 length:258 start_codon:yes stop_codon:yes gene_type:complete
MVEIKVGDKVKWVHHMFCVPHPEGKVCREGKILPVFRNTERTGKVVSYSGQHRMAQVRPDDRTNTPKSMASYYDEQVDSKELTKI